MSSLTKVFDYNDSKVTFRAKEGTVMTNATEMAKSFGKKPNDFLKTQSTKAFLSVLSASRNIEATELVITVNGGVNFGTWMHEDVALEFARWLSPAFAIWCNDRIKELLKFGMTATPQTLEDMIANPDLVIGLATQLKESRTLIAKQQKQIQEAKPKLDYHDRVLTSRDGINTNVIAKELGMSAVSLNRLLRSYRVQYKSGSAWVLTYKYQGKGYTTTATASFNRSNGVGTAIHTKWTEKGRRFIHEFVAKIERETEIISG